MIYRLMNLPQRDNAGELKGIVEGKIDEAGQVQLVCGEWMVCNEINLSRPQDIANTMAGLVNLALEAGFEQGRAHVRKALGL